MNRIFARAFAAILPLLHIVVLGLIATAAFTDFLDLPGTGATEVAIALAAVAAYLLFAGLTSTLVAMRQAMDRMADKLDSRVVRSETPAASARPSPTVAGVPARDAPAGRKEPVLVAIRSTPTK